MAAIAADIAGGVVNNSMAMPADAAHLAIDLYVQAGSVLIGAGLLKKNRAAHSTNSARQAGLPFGQRSNAGT